MPPVIAKIYSFSTSALSSTCSTLLGNWRIELLSELSAVKKASKAVCSLPLAFCLWQKQRQGHHVAPSTRGRMLSRYVCSSLA
jgi:hypothetical protein